MEIKGLLFWFMVLLVAGYVISQANNPYQPTTTTTTLLYDPITGITYKNETVLFNVPRVVGNLSLFIDNSWRGEPFTYSITPSNRTLWACMSANIIFDDNETISASECRYWDGSSWMMKHELRDINLGEKNG